MQDGRAATPRGGAGCAQFMTRVFRCLITFGPGALYDYHRVPDRAGTFGQRRNLGLAASGDLDFPSLPILVGLRPRQHNGDPLAVRSEVVRTRFRQVPTTSLYSRSARGNRDPLSENGNQR